MLIPLGSVRLEGDLVIPENAKGFVLFVHGSGSSRFSPRNRFVAKILQEEGLATLLFDLLTKDEEKEDMYDGHLRFDIRFLSSRLIDVTKAVIENNIDIKNLRIGYFGASTGAAAALVAAAIQNENIKAVVSRGGRPDLADSYLQKVMSPTLLIVGGNDKEVIKLNKEALENIKVEKKLVIVPNATHLFEEPGTLEKVAELASKWFLKYLHSSNL